MVGGLFLLDRESVRTSRALWLPVIWLLILGSRPVSVWLGISGSTADPTSQLAEGSPTDRFVFGALLVLGLAVLFRRGARARAVLGSNWSILIYFAYCLVSVLWSDFPDISVKRWIKALGDLVMVLVVATDPKPVAALKRLYSRVGFILIPASILFIRYFESGRAYDPSGEPMNTGITTNKNSLGLITFTLALVALWAVVRKMREKPHPARSRHVAANAILLVLGLVVLVMAHSATSDACFAVGALLILATGLSSIQGRPIAIHILILMMLLAGGFTMVLGGQSTVFHVFGRQENLTGRTDIWNAVLPVVPNPIVGAGFESFWLGPRLLVVWSRLSKYMHVNEAHNGYIETYLNLGWIGVILIAIVLISAYRGAVVAFRRDPPLGGLMLAFVVAAAIYSITETAFRLLNPIWFFFLFASIGSRALTADTEKKVRLRRKRRSDSSFAEHDVPAISQKSSAFLS